MKMMNKKGQYYPQPRQSYEHVNPVLIIGIAIIMIHFVLRAIQINSPSFVFGLGIIVILIGGFMSIADSV